MLCFSNKMLASVFVFLAASMASLTACNGPNSRSGVQESATDDPKCTANNGTGYGSVYQCGSNFCAKDKADFTVQCRVDDSDPCVAAHIVSAERGLVLDLSKPVYDVGSSVYYNVCEANSGNGFGTLWSCGNAKCANTTNAVPATSFCRVSGGTLVPADQLNAKAKSVITAENACKK